eukprot:CAMPEP_0114527490 /NCGR_PEP_ID=MMETSP0109-20121206/23648_1 /TAXON_ID=29199 /ORGANISM="Chlorarachnion reptans, Strain CCCM449" /LENGTH=247 /DNA_ID=CAMNT_0001709467 /DNA_START=54 /DNA_END=797 /DNA_ORIENTATION=-
MDATHPQEGKGAGSETTHPGSESVSGAAILLITKLEDVPKLVDAVVDKYQKYISIDLPPKDKYITTLAEYSAKVNRIILQYTEMERKDPRRKKLRANLEVVREAWVNPRLLAAMKSMFENLIEHADGIVNLMETIEPGEDLNLVLAERVKRISDDAQQHDRRIQAIIDFKDMYMSTIAWDNYQTVNAFVRRHIYSNIIDWFYPPRLSRQTDDAKANNHSPIVDVVRRKVEDMAEKVKTISERLGEDG